jgi:hypothetical protein
MIGGFIVGGETGYSKVVTRALGPSLGALGVAGALPDPNLELHDANGSVLMSNDNWAAQQSFELESAALAPTDDREAAAMSWLPTGAYTVVVRGSGGTSGVALIEAYAVQ